MKMRSKLIIVFVASIVMAIAAFSLVGCGSPKNAPITDADYTVSGASVVDAGNKFTPVIEAKNGATIKSVQLINKSGKTVALGDDYSFNADSPGIYTYKITFGKGDETKEVTFTVTSSDKIAPIVTQKISDKTGVEIGYYDNFATDLKELVLTDNCDSSEHLTVRVASIEFGDETYPTEGEGFFFSGIGEYTIVVEVSDRSGNATRTDYKITTVDTTAPVIKAVKPYLAWLGSSVAIQKPEVFEIGGYDLAVTVKKGNAAVENDGETFTPDGEGEYTLTYVATDENGNVSAPETTTVRVVAAGTLSDLSYGTEITDYEISGSEKYTDGGEMIVYGTGTGSIVRKSVNRDWSAFRTINIELTNYKASSPALRLAVEQNGEYVTVCDFGITAANSSSLAPATPVGGVYAADLTKYGLDLTAVDSFRLSVVGKGAYKIGLKKVTLTSAAPDLGAKPTTDYTAAIDFDGKTFASTATFGGGFKPTTESKYVLKGEKAALYEIKAGGYVGNEFNEIKTADAANTLVAYAFSESHSDIRLGATFGGSGFKSGIFALNAGWNRLEWHVGLENGFTFDVAGMTEFCVYLEENYDATVAVDEIGLINKTGFTDDEIFIDPVTFGVSYGDAFVMPDVVRGNGKLAASIASAVIAGEKTLSEVKATENNGITDENALAVGASKTLASGKYTLVYDVTDALGAHHVAVYPLNAERNLLSFSATIPHALYRHRLPAYRHRRDFGRVRRGKTCFRRA